MVLFIRHLCPAHRACRAHKLWSVSASAARATRRDRFHLQNLQYPVSLAAPGVMFSSLNGEQMLLMLSLSSDSARGAHHSGRRTSSSVYGSVSTTTLDPGAFLPFTPVMTMSSGSGLDRRIDPTVFAYIIFMVYVIPLSYARVSRNTLSTRNNLS